MDFVTTIAQVKPVGTGHSQHGDDDGGSFPVKEDFDEGRERPRKRDEENETSGKKEEHRAQSINGRFMRKSNTEKEKSTRVLSRVARLQHPLIEVAG
ncbi:hypothetical protein MTO96_046597 [Rhipicephalus appendiculatus]